MANVNEPANSGTTADTQGENQTVAATEIKQKFKADGVTPWWVNENYSYDPANPRKPNMREMMEAISGTDVDSIYAQGGDYQDQIIRTSSEMLYGVVGSNTDTRDWNAIMNVRRDEIVKAAQIATNQMYGGVTVEVIQLDPAVEGSDDFVAMLTAGNGQKLRSMSLATNPDFMKNQLENFGVRDTSFVGTVENQINNILPTLSGDKLTIFQNQIAKPFFENVKPKFLEEGFYNPWAEVESFWDTKFTTGMSTLIQKEPVKTETTTTGTTGGTLGVVEQTITAPGESGTTTETVTQPTYETPQAAEAVPQSTTPFTPTPTTPSGQPVAVGVTPTGVYPQAPVSGTMGTPIQTAGASSVPQSVQVMPNYTGTTISNLTSPSQSTAGMGTGVFVPEVPKPNVEIPTVPSQPIVNAPVNLGGGRGTGSTPYSGPMSGGPMSGNPNAPRPSLSQLSTDQELVVGPDGWYVRAFAGFAEGGLVAAEKSMASKFLGFKGGDLEKFLEANPAAAAKMGKYRTALRNKMTQKGTVFAQQGTFVDAAQNLANVSGLSVKGQDPYQQELAAMQRGAIEKTMQPVQATTQFIAPEAADFIAPTAGMATAVAPMAQAQTVGTVEQAQMPMMTAAGQMAPTAVTPQVQAATQAMQPVTGTVSQQAQVEAAQQVGTSISGIDAAQGNAILMDNPVQRQITTDPVTGQSEIISGAANAETASAFTEQIQAATATPSKKATVAGQLETLMADFEGGETPAWAAGSMRTAMQTLAARGLGASSLAGQAVIQAAMEAALPIAQMDAQTMAQFEAQNLSNRQQRAMLAAQQRATFLGQEFDQAFQARVQNSARIGEIANMNFTAEQNIALENSRAANTVNLNNLSNRQAMVMAEAAALSQLDMSNLNNRQQAAVQNAQNFLQMDMQNLSNEQQTAMFKAQQNIQALFTDQAAENAAAQFNAQSENQTNQFFANLSNQTAQFNATQQNAMDQFNVNSVNALREFNSELQQQRDMFNAQNGLVIAQSNAQWRQNIATLNTATQNQSNMDFAKTINALTSSNMDQIWQRERDIMSFAFGAAESAANRAAQIAIAKLTAEEQAKLQDSIGQGKLAAIALDAVLGKWL